MIILIAGASHTGKTLLASRLIVKYVYQGRVYSCLSLDLLKMGLIRSGNTALTPYDDEKLTPYLTHTDDITRFGSVIEKRPDDTVDIPELIADNERNLAECRARGLGFILIDKDYDAAQRTEEV